jgi:hypothetical protein
MSLPLYPDGCVIPNIRTKNYLVYFAPKCEHTKLRGAYIGIVAESADAAQMYALTSIRLAGLSPVSVVEIASMPELAIVESAV